MNGLVFKGDLTNLLLCISNEAQHTNTQCAGLTFFTLSFNIHPDPTLTVEITVNPKKLSFPIFLEMSLWVISAGGVEWRRWKADSHGCWKLRHLCVFAGRAKRTWITSASISA